MKEKDVPVAGRQGGADLRDHERFVREGPRKGFVEPRLLYLIKGRESYGYRLSEEIGRIPFPGPSPDAAAVYRALREMERSQLLRSRWEEGEEGPARRIYSITPRGEERLEAWLDALRERVDMLSGFISLCDSAGGGRKGRRKGG
ncbi:MAG: helix-turn-helix transcriptional regulator [Actinobacteria bacterium]|nr:helix-turn-helix transcriptional regulator [Actinomycetota bacterium]